MRLAALLTLLLAGCGRLEQSPLLVRIFGPPQQQLVEAYADSPGTATVDHAPFSELLGRHVKGVSVDYAGLAKEEAALDAYLATLAAAPFDELSRDGKLALLINAYNAFTLKLILDHRPLDSIKDIPSGDRWDAVRWTVGGRTLSLTRIEHEELRAKFVEPRIHFAINCASVGCPPLRDEAYVPERIDAQLEAATRFIHEDARWVDPDPATRTARLTSLYLWYAGDFAQVAGSPLAFAARYRPELAEGAWAVEHLDYDWSLNGVTR